ncbi:unnamed protein product [Scytosiphon promiscuus]
MPGRPWPAFRVACYSVGCAFRTPAMVPRKTVPGKLNKFAAEASHRLATLCLPALHEGLSALWASRDVCNGLPFRTYTEERHRWVRTSSWHHDDLLQIKTNPTFRATRHSV